MINDTQSRLGQLQSQFRDQSEKNAQLKKKLGALQRRPTPPTAPTHTATAEPTAAPATKVKVPKPDLYRGDRKKTQDFITQLNDYIHFSHGQFANEAEKVLYASTFLRDSAEQWFRPYKREQQEKPSEQRNEATVKLFSSYSAFTRALKEAFTGLDEARLATRTLMNLKQKGSVQDYTTRFQDAVYLTAGQHSDATLQAFYYQGLREEIKDAMVYHDRPENLSKLIELAQLMDRRRNERWFDKKPYGANSAQPRRPRHTQEGGDAMELDNTQRGTPTNNNKGRSQNYGKGKRTQRREWTPQQKSRFEKGLCIHCGDK